MAGEEGGGGGTCRYVFTCILGNGWHMQNLTLSRVILQSFCCSTGCELCGAHKCTNLFVNVDDDSHLGFLLVDLLHEVVRVQIHHFAKLGAVRQNIAKS